MKAVEMFRDFDYRPHPRFCVKFRAGVTYRRVIESAASEIVRAEAGRVLPNTGALVDAAGTVDASPAWRVRQVGRRR